MLKLWDYINLQKDLKLHHKITQRELKHKNGARKWPRQSVTFYLAGRSSAPASQLLGSASELKLYLC